jgi:hypothetical protein
MTASDPATRRTGRDPVPGSERATGVIDWPAVRRASQSCCCIARPSVVVVLQPTHDRPHPTEVLLCGHHFGRSRPTLLASRALAFSLDGEHLPITAQRTARVNAEAAA